MASFRIARIRRPAPRVRRRPEPLPRLRWYA
jgi:hypothetical protein